MPFTGSHVAAVLPFLGWRLPASALVIGSVVPDVPYYLPVPVNGEQTHTLLGVVGADLLLGLVAFLAWQAFVGPAVVVLAPPVISRRLTVAWSSGAVVGVRATVRHPGRFVAVVAALLLGSLTHVVWDAFTHIDGWAVEQLPFLRADLGPLPLYRWAQYLSGIVGGLIVVAWTVRWWRTSPVTAGAPGSGSQPLRGARAVGPVARGAAIAVVLVAAAVGGVRGLISGLASDADPIRAAAFQAATNAGGWGAVALISIAAVLAFINTRR